MEHLKHKKYKDIYQHLEQTEKSLDKFSKKKSFDNIINEKIKLQMKEFFPNFDKYSHGIDYTYDPFVIIDLILALWSRQIEDISMLTIKKHGEKYCIITKHGTRPQMISTIESKLDLEKYKELLKSITTDKSFKKIFEDEIKEYQEIQSELDNFTSKLKLLIRKLSVEKLLEGKCDGCA